LEARQKGTTPDPRIDAAACRNLADSAEKALKERVASEAGPTPSR